MMEKNIFGTPEPSLSVELRSVLDKENILTTKTKKKVLELLDEHIVNDEDRKIGMKRKNIVQEIYKSEESYLNQLEKLIKFFKTPMEKLNMAPVSVLNALFGNVESIYDINKEFLARLKENKNNVVSVFLTTAPFFKVYSVYAYSYKQVINMLESMPKSNPTLHEFICKQETRPEVGIKISSLLISPVQRIPRYLLLLKELKLLTPESTFEYSELQEAVNKINSIVEHIESLIKEQENVSRMISIQRSLLNGKPHIIGPGRKLIKEGKLMKVIKENVSPRYLVLLSDMILFCKDWSGSSLKCLRVLPIGKCVINAIGFKRSVFSLQCQSFSVVLCSVDDPNDTQKWVDAIQNAVYQYDIAKKSLRKESTISHPLQRKDFHRLDHRSNILKRKKKSSEHNKEEIQGDSPWKKFKSCTTIDCAEPQRLLEDKTKEKSQESTSYVKLAKQLISNVKQTTQKLMTEIDSGICPPLPEKPPAITD